MVCSLLYSLTFVSDLATKGALHVIGDQIYGYTIVADVCGLVSWLFSLLLICRERVRIALSQPHSYTLMLFWLVGVVLLGLEVVSYNSPLWWWHLASKGDIADMTVFLVRGVILCVLLVVGVARPLCRRRGRSYSLLVNADSAEDTDTEVKTTSQREREGDFVKSRTNSTFTNMWSKVRQLFPYVWPKGTPNLQSM